MHSRRKFLGLLAATPVVALAAVIPAQATAIARRYTLNGIIDTPIRRQGTTHVATFNGRISCMTVWKDRVVVGLENGELHYL